MGNREEFLAALSSVLSGVNNSNSGPVDITYAIYARKSTDDSERQTKSLGDQIAECQEMAARLNLKINPEFIIKESESAKESGIRPKFKALLKAIEANKVRGILAWHPDRLARNMKDAGEVIDLVDREIILDLKFPSFSFENSASGKMLLGIAFVISKQYSDKLSDDVTRGIKRRIEEGKYLARPKHGYYKDVNSYLRPDGDNFSIIKEAFIMRLDGKTLDDIAEAINKMGYKRKTSGGDKDFAFTKTRLSDLFREPTYAGFLKFGETVVDLTQHYDFIPMISLDEYKTLNASSPIGRAYRLYQRKNKGEIVADLMRGMIICDECSTKMQASIARKVSKGKTTRYFYFRCDTQTCKRWGKSIRAKVIVDFVVDFLKNNSLAKKDSYKKYQTEVRELKLEKGGELGKALRSTLAQFGSTKSRFENTKKLLLEETDAYTREIFKKELKTIDETMQDQQRLIDDIRTQIGGIEHADITYSEFLELYQKLPSFIENCGEMSDLDFMIRSMFLNFTIKDQKVANYTIKSPFGDLIETSNILFSRGNRT